MKQTTPPSRSVSVRQKSLSIPTYVPAEPDKNPMFLDKRVYQGSSGRIYPLPFTDRIAENKVDKDWQAIELENDFVRLTILPELGGRIHFGYDKTNGYDFLYRQNVIKPALVGVTGPWISGGIEFNWPQHHRPSTFMPTDVEIEEHKDGSVTVWLSEHEPMNRMKGMHGICLHPNKSVVEIKARVHNRTESVQTFLWWANIATRVHSAYQAFFPTDVTYVADHAKRSMSAYPLCQGKYYGFDYAQMEEEGTKLADPRTRYQQQDDYQRNDLGWYANIPVPTSYMCMETGDDFFGGYDHKEQAGLVHVANHHISPGKKLWTWGNHPFGYCWDRHLTDPRENGEYPPYIELMAGVYTDNQPDFSFLAPGETKTWSQFIYPIQKIGVPCQANINAAISLSDEGGHIRVGIATTANREAIEVCVRNTESNETIDSWVSSIGTSEPVFKTLKAAWQDRYKIEITVTADDQELIRHQPRTRPEREVPPAASEPSLPAEIDSVEKLYLTGLHLHQYRHATRKPEDYWREALRRDEGDARCNNAMGLWHLRRGEFETAEKHFRKAIHRLTELNPNPYDGEPYYNLGLSLRHQQRYDEAYAAFHKAVWNHAWQAPGYFALAEIDCRKADWNAALNHLDRCLRMNVDHNKARNLRVMVLKKLGKTESAVIFLRETLNLDPLDVWARHLDDGQFRTDCQSALDLALDLARSGFYQEAIQLLQGHSIQVDSDPRSLGCQPLLQYYLGWLHLQQSERDAAEKAFANAAELNPDYCFPARLEEIGILRTALATRPEDARAHYYLGNLFYDRYRRDEAIALWEEAARLEPTFAITLRNLGIAYYNVMGQPEKALDAYDRALKANPDDARLLFERDQLWKRTGRQPVERLQELEKFPQLIRRRDDLSVELCELYNQLDQADKALAIMLKRVFQPWEGGEGQVLNQYVRSCLSLGRKALANGAAEKACEHFEAALQPPENLGESSHLLANQSDIYYWLGIALDAAGKNDEARKSWQRAASFRGDFQEMSVQEFSEMTYYSALALRQLGQDDKATELLKQLLEYGKKLEQSKARIDYFATSLPTMLVFNEDIQFRQETMARFLQAQAHHGLGNQTDAQSLIRDVLSRDPNHPRAAEFQE